MEDISKWQDTPIIVSENATKDALQLKHLLNKLVDISSGTTHNRKQISDPMLKQHLLSMTSNNTGHRLGHIPLVIRMAVMIMTNFDVSNSVINGRMGTLKSVPYWMAANMRPCVLLNLMALSVMFSQVWKKTKLLHYKMRSA